MSRAAYVATFAAGAVLATAIGARATPRTTKAERRYQALDSFAQVLATIGTDYVQPIDDSRLLRNGVRGMVAGLDAYSTYLAPEQYRRVRQDTDGEYGGVGITFGFGTLLPGDIPGERNAEAGEPLIEAVQPGSPAEAAGVQLGDHVVAVDGELTSVPGQVLDDAARWEAAMRGASGTRVRLTIRRLGWTSPRDLSIVRVQLKVPSVQAIAVEKGIGYVAIARFAEATAADLDAALGTLDGSKDLRALVLDLRGDPGGLVDAGVAVADLLLDAGTIVTVHGRDVPVERHVAHAAGTWRGFPMVCLVDEGTASAAEIVTAALRDHDRCTVVGMPTYGKGSVQTFFDLDDGGGLKLTTAIYRSPNGIALEGKGIIPDVRVEGWAEEIVAGATDGEADPGAGEGAGEGAAPTTDAKRPPGGDVTVDARLKAELVDDPQVQAALGILRRALASQP